MRATVTYPYRDRETLEVHRTGDEVEPAPDGAAQPEGPAQAEHEPPREMTAAQLRAEIEARGGFAPKKATKAQLAELLGSL